MKRFIVFILFSYLVVSFMYDQYRNDNSVKQYSELVNEQREPLEVGYTNTVISDPAGDSDYGVMSVGSEGHLYVLNVRNDTNPDPDKSICCVTQEEFNRLKVKKDTADCSSGTTDDYGGEIK